MPATSNVSIWLAPKKSKIPRKFSMKLPNGYQPSGAPCVPKIITFKLSSKPIDPFFLLYLYENVLLATATESIKFLIPAE
ncbi:hypothetical protein DCBHLPFO_00791 [Mycoplasmopsis arginini]|uniref:Uncharacterized protein n=1 Tax=Mycoplasmopsis arginini TaxID=2094 RepID=A0AA43U080_MYCAR|nr:hypothetical protein [Mycoplasmopsis arginini]